MLYISPNAMSPFYVMFNAENDVQNREGTILTPLIHMYTVPYICIVNSFIFQLQHIKIRGFLEGEYNDGFINLILVECTLHIQYSSRRVY